MQWKRRSGWIYAGLVLLALSLVLMVMRYLGVVFETNASAQLALHGATEGAATLLHLSSILDWVRWRWIAYLLFAAGILTFFGLGRDWWRSTHKSGRW